MQYLEYLENESALEQEITKALGQYYLNAPKIRIGDSQNAVLSLLPRQRKYRERPSDFSMWEVSRTFASEWEVIRGSAKEPRFYFDNGILVQIYYFRSSWIRDGKVTDDEFTPYIFRDGVLTSIGWRVLGGPNSFGSPSPPRD